MARQVRPETCGAKLSHWRRSGASWITVTLHGVFEDVDVLAHQHVIDAFLAPKPASRVVARPGDGIGEQPWLPRVRSRVGPLSTGVTVVL